MECVFCKYGLDDSRKVGENKYFYFMYDVHPVTPGHLLIIPKDHTIGLLDLNEESWADLKNTLEQGIKIIKKTNLVQVYQGFIESSTTPRSCHKYCKGALEKLNNGVTFEDFNHGVNDGSNAGRTVGHLHRHIIPRFEGDMEDPRGGVRHVIPEMGNYKIPRN